MKEAFDKYVKNYDMTNKDILLKYHHSYRVQELSLKYAKDLELNEEDINLAGVIGLLHDIGRFEQLKVYKTYNDAISIDHADYSVVQLFDKGEIRKFTDIESTYEIIKLAIKNHNKYMITGVSDDRTLIHCHLIRDTDKIDILYNCAILNEIKLKEDNSLISEKTMKYIRDEKSVKHFPKKTTSDKIASFMALILDIHYNKCLVEAKEYIDIIFNNLENKEKFREVKNIIDEFVEKRIGIYVK